MMNETAFKQLYEDLQRNLSIPDLEFLRQWCFERGYPACESTNVLKSFLQSCQNRCINEARQKIENYYFTRRSHPQFFQNLDIHSQEVKKIFDTIAIIPLKNSMWKEAQVIFIRPLEIERQPVGWSDAIKAFNMVLDLCIDEEGPEKEHIIVVDIYGDNFLDQKTFDSYALEEYSKYLKDFAPIRWRELHLINTIKPIALSHPYIMTEMYENPYVRDVHLHSSLYSLHQMLSRTVLPNELEGEAGFLRDMHAMQMEKLKNRSAWFRQMSKCM